jgi:hypothetical protein
MRFRKNLRIISGQKRAHAGLKWKFLEKSRFTVRWSRVEGVSEMKSILKKLTEFEERAINACRRYRMDDDYALEDFIEDLRQIMPPVCTETERKFLDELKEKYEWDNDDRVLSNKEGSKIDVIHQDHFDANLSELVKKKQ